MKSTAFYLLLLCWPVMLCFSVLSQATAKAHKPLRASISSEILTPGQQELPVAWLEQATEHTTTAGFHKVSLVPLPRGRQTRYTSFTCQARLVKPNRSFASLSTCFRIFPNAP